MNKKGLTLVEVLASGFIVACAALILVHFLKSPITLSKMVAESTAQESGYHFTVIPVDDFKRAISVSIQWGLIDPSLPNPPYDPATHPNLMPWFKVNDWSIQPPGVPVSHVCYAYRATTQELVRYSKPLETGVPAPATCPPDAADGAQEKVVAKGLLAPTAKFPLFKKDPAAQEIVILTLRLPGPGGKETRVVRRVHIRT